MIARIVHLSPARWSLLVLSALLAIGVTGCGPDLSNPQSTLRGLYEQRMFKGNKEAIREFFASETALNSFDLPKELAGREQSYRYDGSVVLGNGRAGVAFTVDDKRYYHDVWLTRVEEDWKIDRVKSARSLPLTTARWRAIAWAKGVDKLAASGLSGRDRLIRAVALADADGLANGHDESAFLPLVLTDAAELPSATGPALVISTHGLYVDGERVSELAELRVMAKDKPGNTSYYFRVDTVVAALEGKRENGDDGPLVVGITMDAPYNLVLEVLYSAGQAGYNEFWLAARKADDTPASGFDVVGVPISAPPYADYPNMLIATSAAPGNCPVDLIGAAPIVAGTAAASWWSAASCRRSALGIIAGAKAVAGDEQPFELCPIDKPSQGRGSHLSLTLGIAENGLYLAGKNGVILPNGKRGGKGPSIPAADDGTIDLLALAELLNKVVETEPDAHSILLAADPAVQYPTVLEVALVVYGNPDAPRFRQIFLGWVAAETAGMDSFADRKPYVEQALGDVKLITWSQRELPNLEADIQKTIETYDERIQKAIQPRLADAKACYDERKEAGVKPKGSIEFRFDVDRDGKVETVEVADDKIKDAPLAACITKKASNWRFPKPPCGPTSIVYPMTFGGN